MTTQIIQNYSFGTKEAYNKLNEMFDYWECINGGKVSKKWNDGKTKVEFNHEPYRFQGNIQLLADKLILNADIPKSRTFILNRIFFNMDLAKQEEQVERNLEHFIEGDLKERFN